MTREEIMKMTPKDGHKFIYRYWDKDGSYIGQTKKSLKARAGKNGKNYCKRQSVWADNIKKKGLDSFEVEILCECPKAEANKKEKLYIKQFNSRKKGYNSTSGGTIYYSQMGAGEMRESRIIWEWKYDDSILSASAKEINRILCDEIGLKSPDEFAKYRFEYHYYAFEREFTTYKISLGLLIDNFNIYKNADYILKDYSNRSLSLLSYLIDVYCPQEECLGGDILTSGIYLC